MGFGAGRLHRRAYAGGVTEISRGANHRFAAVRDSSPGRGDGTARRHSIALPALIALRI
jgi:hypothetical protein